MKKPEINPAFKEFSIEEILSEAIARHKTTIAIFEQFPEEKEFQGDVIFTSYAETETEARDISELVLSMLNKIKREDFQVFQSIICGIGAKLI